MTQTDLSLHYQKNFIKGLIMNKEYRFDDVSKSEPMLDFRLDMADIDYRSRLIEPCNSGRDFLTTEYDVIMAWADLARNAHIGKYRESDLKCWEGHYEQFGLVMLNLANMSRYRKGYDGLWEEWYDIFLSEALYSGLYRGPIGKADRIFFYCWFRLLGHPDYQCPTIDDVDFYFFSGTEICLRIAYQDLNCSLFTKTG